MAKISKTHAVAINKLMIPLINSVAYIDNDENDLGMFKMYAGDIAYNAAALSQFNDTLDAAKLHDNIMRQDTSPREHFYTVLRYIEDNKLIPVQQYTCN
jgi:hypothetical protein